MYELISDIWRKKYLTIVMVTHDIKEGFALESRLWFFDKVRHASQATNAYGAKVSLDLPLKTKQDKVIAK